MVVRSIAQVGQQLYQQSIEQGRTKLLGNEMHDDVAQGSSMRQRLEAVRTLKLRLSVFRP